MKNTNKIVVLFSLTMWGWCILVLSDVLNPSTPVSVGFGIFSVLYANQCRIWLSRDGINSSKGDKQ